MAKKSKDRPKDRPNATNTDTTIVSVSGVGQESFDALLQLQQKSVEFQRTISDILKQSLLTQRATAIEELIISQKTGEEVKLLGEMRDSLSDIAKTLKDMASSAMVAAGGNVSTSNTSSALITNSKEDKNEAALAENEKINLLRQIEKNTRTHQVKKEKEEKPEKEGIGLGGLVTALAAGLGVIVGAMRAQVKAIKYFIELLAPEALLTKIKTAMNSFIELLTPNVIMEKIRKAMASFMAGISMYYDLVKVTITEKFPNAIKFLDNVIDSSKAFFGTIAETARKAMASFMAGISMFYDLTKVAITEKFPNAIKFLDNVIDSSKAFFGTIAQTIKGLFTIGGEESSISKIISAFMSGVNKIMAPFSEAFTVIKDFLSGPIGKVFESIKGVFTGASEAASGFFTTLTETFGKFGSIFKSVATIAEKIFLPITILMTVWDTVKGAMEGYEKDGIVGAISGAIKGFFNSLIFGPLDMLKDAMAWVAGFFGFENAKKTLESFSLEKLFGDFIDMLFSPVKTFRAIMAKVGDFFETLRGFKIPEIGFTIPKWVPGIGGDKVGLGPWYPFGKSSETDSSTNTPSSSVTPSPENSSVKTAQTDSSTNTPSSSVTPSPQAESPKVVSSRSSFTIPSWVPFIGGNTINPSSVAPSPQTESSNTVSSQSNAVSAMKENKQSTITTVVAPSVNNNVQQTQVAKVDSPVRSNESSLDRYVSARVVY